MEIDPGNNPIWLLNYISAATIALPVIASIWCYGKLSFPLRIFSWLLFYSAANAVLTLWLSAKGMNNLMFVNIFTLVELALFGWVFHKVFQGRAMKTFIAIAIVVLGVFIVINMFFLQGFTAINSYSKALQCLLIALLALLFLYKIFKEEKVQRLERYPLFWVSSGALIYFAGNFLLFACSSYVLVESSTLDIEWSIHSVLHIMANLIYTVAFWWSPQN